MPPYSFPLTLGLDFSGTIASTGPGVNGHAIGEEVYGRAGPMRLGQLDGIARPIDAGSLTVTVSEVFPMAQAVHADTRLETGHVREKLALERIAQ